MKFHLDKDVKDIKIFKDLITLMKGIDDLNIINNIDDIYYITHNPDPVRDFIDFYNSDGNLNLNYDRIIYIYNSLFAAKGAPKVIDLLADLFEIDIEWNFEFPYLDVNFKEKLRISNIELFLSKFENAIWYLLYYGKLSIEIKELILLIKDELIQYSSILTTGYRVHKVETFNSI